MIQNADSLNGPGLPVLSAGRPSTSSVDERVQLQRLRAREPEAFSRLLDEYHGPLLRLALAFVPSRAVAEEVVQETWVGVLNGLERFEGRSSLRTWIYRILTNRAKTRGTREKRSVPLSSFEEGDNDSPPAVASERFAANGMWRLPPRRWDEQTPERQLLAREVMPHLERAIAALPPTQRAVVTLRDIDELSPEETCNVLEITEINQRVLLHRARSTLRTVLEQFVDRK